MTMIQEKKRVLGRGLESLIPAARATAAPREKLDGEAVVEVRLEEIEPSPYQPRRHQDEAALNELAASIRATGVLQPIVLRYISPPNGSAAPERDNETAGKIKYQLIAGERRWRASQRAGRATVPAIIRQVSNEQAVEMALVENLQREDLDAMEMAHAFERLSRDFHLTQEEMAQRTGKDRTTISNYLRLLRLPEEVQTAVEKRELAFGHARALMSLEDAALINQALKKVLEQGLSVRATEALVSEMLWLNVPDAKQPKPARVVDPNIRAAERELEQKLGTRVRIHDKNGKGKVVIEYHSLEDFDRIVEALGK